MSWKKKKSGFGDSLIKNYEKIVECFYSTVKVTRINKHSVYFPRAFMGTDHLEIYNGSVGAKGQMVFLPLW